MAESNASKADIRSRGITDRDVWHAADALLLAGQRPTIERVRQHIGRGSPNTVSPHLDTWFASLGSRIADPQVFRAPAADAAAPEPVQALARQLWDTAQALARGQAESRALAAEALAADALAERDATRAALAVERERAQALASELDALRLTHAAEHASLTERLHALGLQVQASADALAQVQSDAAQRVTQAERRAGADMDRERQARARAEQLARDARTEFDRTLADERERTQAQFVAQVQAFSRLEARALALQERLDRVEAERLRVRIKERRALPPPTGRVQVKRILRPHVLGASLDEGYQAMAADTEREAEALQWSSRSAASPAR